MEKKNIFAPTGSQAPDVQPIARRCTDWAILAYNVKIYFIETKRALDFT
jgi:hypothetical protein